MLMLNNAKENIKNSKIIEMTQSRKITKSKMDSKLFVPAKLTFSEYLRCLNFPLWILWPAKTKQV